jgi:ADP-ribose pyrophosphatase YjhB (NUDIX family)
MAAVSRQVGLRQRILALFSKHRGRKFSQIEQELGARSNLVAYHLKALQEEGLLRKSGSGKESLWSLTAKGESYLPEIDLPKMSSSAIVTPLVVVLAAALRTDVRTKQQQVLLWRRSDRPYQHHWGMPGGKVKFGESLEDAAVRKLRSIDVPVELLLARSRTSRVRGFMNETVLDKDAAEFTVKHHFFLVLVTVDVPAKTSAGTGKWFSLKRLPKQMIPSDAWLIDWLSRRGSGSRCGEVVMIDAQGQLRETLIRQYR